MEGAISMPPSKEWPFICEDLELCGWQLHKSETSGDDYFWNKNTGDRLWVLPVPGWGWKLRDHRKPSQGKQYVHVLTGKKQHFPPSSQVDKKLVATDNMPTNRKKRVIKTLDRHIAKKPKQTQSKSALTDEFDKPSIAKTQQQLGLGRKFKKLSKDERTASGTETAGSMSSGMSVTPSDRQLLNKKSVDNETSKTAKASSRKSPWHHIDTSMAKVTDPKLLVSIDWNNTSWRKQTNNPHVLQAFNNKTTIYESLSTLPFT